MASAAKLIVGSLVVGFGFDPWNRTNCERKYAMDFVRPYYRAGIGVSENICDGVFGRLFG